MQKTNKIDKNWIQISWQQSKCEIHIFVDDRNISSERHTVVNEIFDTKS